MDFETLMQTLFGVSPAMGAELGQGGGAMPGAMPPAGGPTGGMSLPPNPGAPGATLEPTPPMQQAPEAPPSSLPFALRRMLGAGPTGGATPMGPYVDQGPPAPTTLGGALEPQQPQPAPGTPLPPRDPRLGLGTTGDTPGSAHQGYGGSPETNPNLRPIGSPAAKPQAPDLAKILQGIKPPPPVDVVKPSTPAAPQRGQVGPSQLLQLLASLGMGGSRGMRMPTTLGQALELKPSAWGGMYG